MPSFPITLLKISFYPTYPCAFGSKFTLVPSSTLKMRKNHKKLACMLCKFVIIVQTFWFLLKLQNIFWTFQDPRLNISDHFSTFLVFAKTFSSLLHFPIPLLNIFSSSKDFLWSLPKCFWLLSTFTEHDNPFLCILWGFIILKYCNIFKNIQISLSSLLYWQGAVVESRQKMFAFQKKLLYSLNECAPC